MTQATDDIIPQGYNDISSSTKSNSSTYYRELVAQSDCAAWRGAAREKIAVKIEEGVMEQGCILETSMKHKPDDKVIVPGLATMDLVGAATASEQDTKQQYMEDAPTLPSDTPPSPPIPHETRKASDEPLFEISKGILDTDKEWVSAPVNKKEKKETTAPSTYKSYNDDDTFMEDVELGGGTDLEGNFAELELDKGAFERFRSLEQRERAQRKKHRCLVCLWTIASIAVLLLLVLISLLITTLVQTSNRDNKPPQIIHVVAQKYDASSLPNLDKSVTLSQERNFTGLLKALQDPETSNESDNRITIKFPVNMLVPVGSSVLYKVYDGPHCGNGAKDITGLDQYVQLGLYSAGFEPQNDISAARMGMYLQWMREDVQDSPLYTWWRTASPGPSLDPSLSETLGLCVALRILDPRGLPEHHMETYIFTTWHEDRLQSVQTIPITSPSRKI